jgi:glycosyltransferase involved in cell wall biosynthesis
MTRVAYFPDSFHEVNGVAHTSRHFEDYARRHGLPFLCVRAALKQDSQENRLQKNGEQWSLELGRQQRASFRLDKDLSFDLTFMRHLQAASQALREFRPDVVHITGPSDVGILGAWLAWRQKVPLAAGWHTNLHEYAGRRAHWFIRMLPDARQPGAERAVEDATLRITQRFYATARVTFAPNAELVAMLHQATGRPCHLMQRGLDTELFSPQRRTRAHSDAEFVVGYVGRLSVEKNVTYLPFLQKQLQMQLQAQGIRLRFLIVGQGAEEEWLRANLQNAEFAGVLRGEALAEAYANMDLFCFPSHTDTFGNVVLEALASGVPALVTPSGGPKFLVEDGVTGFIREETGFADAASTLALSPTLLAAMRCQARKAAMSRSWDAVFAGVYRGYADAARHPASEEQA